MDLSKERIKKEIEAKKKRLEELKAKRAARRANLKPRAPPPSSSDSKPPPPSATESADAVLGDVANLVGQMAPRRNVTLTAQLQAPQNVEAVIKHTYDVGMQCDLGGNLKGEAAEQQKELASQQVAMEEKEEKLKILMEQVKLDRIKYDQIREDERLKEVQEFTPGEQKSIMESTEFQNFFTKASKMIERAVNQSYDITIDYGDDGEEKTEEASVFERCMFKDEKKTSDRAVTSIAWSTKYPELFLSSYAGQDDQMSLQPDGTVLVWNLHLSSRPEYYFYCNSTVLTAAFHPSNPKLIVAGCQSGQVVIWDTREKSSPVNRTSLTNGHSHPVYSLATVPLVNRVHNLVSVSTDGHLCVWSDNNLHDPSTELHLQHGKEEITTTSFDFPGRETNLLTLGSDEGYLYKARIYDQEKNIYEAIPKAHDAPITNVQFHPISNNAPSNISDLFLTSSYDWTVKLWSNKTNRPLYTFESARDYVYDVQWSPVHPAVFASGDGSGRLDLWNLNKFTDVPVQKVQVKAPSRSGQDTAAINKLSWSDDGQHIACGTSSGSLHIYSVGESLCQPTTEDANDFYDAMHKQTLSTSSA